MARTEDANMKVMDALDHARVAAQELHAALTDAAAQRRAVMKDDLAIWPLKARAIAESLGHSLDSQNVVTKQAISEAMTYLDATQAHISDALRTSGLAAEGLVRSAILDARESVQKISEAVAARRECAPAPGSAA